MPTPKTKKPNAARPTTDGMTIRLALFTAMVMTLTFGLVFVWSKIIEKPAPVTPTPVVPAVVPAPVLPEPDPTPEPYLTTPLRERPAGMICDELNYICIEEAASSTLLTSPFIIKGNGSAFENHINWRLLDGNGQEIEKGFVMAQPQVEYGPGDFTIRAFITSVPKTEMGTLEALEYSAKDGEPINVAKVPVRLPSQTMIVRYFAKPPGGSTTEKFEIACDEVAVHEATVPRGALPVETSLRYLLARELWESLDRYSAIPEGTRLISLNVSGGTATAVFSPELENYGGGSCNVEAIRAQIESTLKQFSSVKNVVIAVEGKKPEETLQP